MRSIQVGHATEAGSDTKENEDYYVETRTNDHFAATVCDGVSQLRSEDGSPLGGSGLNVAFETATSLRSYFESERVTDVDGVLGTLHSVTNFLHGQIFNTTKPEYRAAATFVCAFGKRQHNGMLKGYVISLGDTLALQFMPDCTPLVLAADQLVPSRRWRRQQGWDEREQAIWSRGIARNNVALRADGVPLGYGAIDGNHEFMHFVNIRPFILPPDCVLLLASDALRVLNETDDSDDPAGYTHLTRQVVSTPTANLPLRLIEQIRQRETDTGKTPDDATIVAIKN